MGYLPQKVWFELSGLDVKKTRFFSFLHGTGFQMGDLAGKLGRVIGAEFKHNKLVTMIF